MAWVTLGFSRATRTRTPENPYPCPGVRVLTGTGTGSTKTQGYATRAWVCPRNRLRNLATAVQVSIDTAMQHCEVSHSVGVAIPSFVHVPQGVLMVMLVFVVLVCVFSYLCSCSCETPVLTRMLIVLTVEPAQLGSVSIHMGEWGWRGHTSCLWVGGLTHW